MATVLMLLWPLKMLKLSNFSLVYEVCCFPKNALDTFGILLGYFCDTFVILFRYCCDTVGILFGYFCDIFEIILGYFLKTFLDTF